MSVATSDLDLNFATPLPEPALRALADLVELRARKLFPEKFVDHPPPEPPAVRPPDDTFVDRAGHVIDA
jgi:hypothetical protein